MVAVSVAPAETVKYSSTNNTCGDIVFFIRNIPVCILNSFIYLSTFTLFFLDNSPFITLFRKDYEVSLSIKYIKIKKEKNLFNTPLIKI